METKTYYVQYLEKKTCAFLSLSTDMKEAAKAARKVLPKGSILLGIYEKQPTQSDFNSPDSGAA